MLDDRLLKDDISAVDLDLVVFTARRTGRECQTSRLFIRSYLYDLYTNLQGLCRYLSINVSDSTTACTAGDYRCHMCYVCVYLILC